MEHFSGIILCILIRWLASKCANIDFITVSTFPINSTRQQLIMLCLFSRALCHRSLCIPFSPPFFLLFIPLREWICKFLVTKLSKRVFLLQRIDANIALKKNFFPPSLPDEIGTILIVRSFNRSFHPSEIFIFFFPDVD